MKHLLKNLIVVLLFSTLLYSTNAVANPYVVGGFGINKPDAIDTVGYNEFFKRPEPRSMTQDTGSAYSGTIGYRFFEFVNTELKILHVTSEAHTLLPTAPHQTDVYRDTSQTYYFGNIGLVLVEPFGIHDLEFSGGGGYDFGGNGANAYIDVFVNVYENWAIGADVTRIFSHDEADSTVLSFKVRYTFGD